MDEIERCGIQIFTTVFYECKWVGWDRKTMEYKYLRQYVMNVSELDNIERMWNTNTDDGQFLCECKWELDYIEKMCYKNIHDGTLVNVSALDYIEIMWNTNSYDGTLVNVSQLDYIKRMCNTNIIDGTFVTISELDYI